MTATKRKPKVGDKAYEVEWCANIPKDEHGDSDHDNADFRFCKFADYDKAVAYAKKVLPKDAYGSVMVKPVTFTAYDEDDELTMPHVGFWEQTGEATVVDE